MRIDPDLALAHLQLLFEDTPAGYIGVSYSNGAGPPTRTEFLPSDNLDFIAQRACQLAEHGHVFVGAGLFERIPDRGRGKAEDIIWIRVATLDFDVGSEGHKNGHQLPRHRSDFHRLLANASEIPPPCLVTDTGNGLLAMWQLEEPLAIRDADDRRRASDLLEAFQGRLRTIAKDQFDWRLDKTSDLPRLLRLAGTLNWKSDPPKPVRRFT